MRCVALDQLMTLAHTDAADHNLNMYADNLAQGSNAPQRRSWAAEVKKQAELILEMVDASRPMSERGTVEFDLPDRANHLRILNKADLGLHPDFREADGVVLSCTERSGIEELSDAILQTLGGSDDAWGASLIAINVRHKDCLNRAEANLAAADAMIESSDSQIRMRHLNTSPPTELTSTRRHVFPVAGLPRLQTVFDNAQSKCHDKLKRTYYPRFLADKWCEKLLTKLKVEERFFDALKRSNMI